ncbi:diacylglycerol kinase family protein [Membranihabitans maritimus]|uniref:diacylglycerol kinase family protein n=1 Tax=Membranihabitans maritimus TaxID=2904244 RepID=UPI001F2064AF|nr:diacylglycerol kinase family protein [Membranihabitans maritimus]
MNKFFGERIHRIKVAIDGLWKFFFSGVHARIHLSSAVIVILLGLYFDLLPWEWVALLIAIAMVVQAEIFNTVLEEFMDFEHPGYHSKIKYMKDLSSAAVLVCAVFAFVIGLIIFIPKIL